MKSKIIHIFKVVFPLLLGFYLIWYFFHSMSQESLAYFYKALSEANYLWIFLSLILSFLCYLSRAYRWKYLLEPMGYKTKFWHRYHALMIGYIINLTIPRAGEVSRAAMLYRSDGVPFSKSFGTIIAERAVDLIMLGSIALLTAFVGYDAFVQMFDQIKADFTSTSENSGSWKYLFYGVVLVGLVIFFVFFVIKSKFRKKLTQFIQDVFKGLLSILKSKNPLAFVGHTLFIWILYVVYFSVAFFSLEETKDFPLQGLLLGFVVGSLGITLTNGGIGVFPLLIAMVVVFFMGDDNPNAQALGNALGMLIWISQTLMMILLGLLSLILLPKNYTKEKPFSEKKN